MTKALRLSLHKSAGLGMHDDHVLTDEEKRHNMIRLVFGGDEERFEKFLSVIRTRFRRDRVVLRAARSQASAGKTGAV